MLTLLVLFRCEIPTGVTSVLRREERKADSGSRAFRMGMGSDSHWKIGRVCCYVSGGSCRELLHKVLLLEVCSCNKGLGWL